MTVEIDQVAITPAIEPYFAPSMAGLWMTDDKLARFIRISREGSIFRFRAAYL